MKVIRQYTAFDGTQMVVYSEGGDHQNTVPLWVFNQMKRKNAHSKTK